MRSKKHKRLEKERIGMEKSIIDRAEMILKKILSVHSSNIKQIDSFTGIEATVVGNIAIATLIKIISNIWTDEKFALFLIKILDERWRLATNEERIDTDRIFFRIACEARFKSVRKKAADILTNRGKAQIILDDCVRNYLDF